MTSHVTLADTGIQIDREVTQEYPDEDKDYRQNLGDHLNEMGREQT